VSNPDSIRLQPQQAKASDSNVDFTPRLAIVAPAFRADVLELSQYITAFSFDFYTITRFEGGDKSFLLLDRLAPLPTTVRPSAAQQEWDWEKLRAEYHYSDA
jgi:hypothetical protein